MSTGNGLDKNTDFIYLCLQLYLYVYLYVYVYYIYMYLSIYLSLCVHMHTYGCKKYGSKHNGVGSCTRASGMQETFWRYGVER